jgi:myo-inositol-1(or 4)-monophosphatase
VVLGHLRLPPRRISSAVVTDRADAEVAVAAALAGAAEVRSRYGGPLVRHAKEGTDFATSADLASEDAIRAVLAGHRPGDAMVGEEGGRTGPSRANRAWLVDPLCGTRNFAAQTPLVAVNVALHSEGTTLAAASADPITGEVFWTDGSGAFVRRAGAETAILPAPTSLLVDVDLDHPDGGEALRLLAHPALHREFSPRVSSTTLALTWLAGGRRAAYLHEGDLRDNVHFAAPVAIALAAGCIVTAVHGEPFGDGSSGLLAAADEATHARLLELITAPVG